jgi:3-oxoacyl-[acyl-carrier protein] reductase
VKLLSDKSAVITGANRGIGLWACARRPDEAFEADLARLAEVHGVRIRPVYFDLADAEGVKAGAGEIVAAGEPVDVLVNNAGVIFTALFQMTPMARMKELFDVNLFAQVAFTQTLVKAMSKRGGSIVNLSSSAAIEGNEGRAAYAASKSAMISFTKVIARELARYGIRANAIAPGLTRTEMMESSTSEAGMQATLARIALGRVGRPEEIANTALFLASDLSSYVTGQVLRVDGGLLG